MLLHLSPANIKNPIKLVQNHIAKEENFENYEKQPKIIAREAAKVQNQVKEEQYRVYTSKEDVISSSKVINTRFDKTYLTVSIAPKDCILVTLELKPQWEILLIQHWTRDLPDEELNKDVKIKAVDDGAKAKMKKRKECLPTKYVQQSRKDESSEE